MTLDYFTPDAVAPLVEHFKPALVGQDPLQIGRLTKTMGDRSRFWAREGAARSVISGIELAPSPGVWWTYAAWADGGHCRIRVDQP